MTPVTITYDDTARAGYIYLKSSDHISVRTQQLSEDVLVDYNAAGDIFGIELLNISRPVIRNEVASPEE